MKAPGPRERTRRFLFLLPFLFARGAASADWLLRI
jgi:hypothetical protein